MSLPPRPLAALCAVADRLAAAGVPWLVTGSVGRALLGNPARPGDLDLEVPAPAIAAAARALGPPPPPHAPPAATGLLAHATSGSVLVHARISSLRVQATVAGVEVDVSAGLVVEGPSRAGTGSGSGTGDGAATRGGLRLPDGFAAMERAASAVVVAGRTIPVAPLEEALVRALVTGDPDQIARVASAAAATPAAPPLRPGYVAERLRSASSTAAA